MRYQRFLLGTVFALLLTFSLGSLSIQVQAQQDGWNVNKAWVWANEPTSDEYRPASNYLYNSEGGSAWIERLERGHYLVQLGRQATSGGVAHVTAYNGNHFCNVGGWRPNGDDLNIDVFCYNDAGRSTDGQFTLLFYREIASNQGRDSAYLWANDPSDSRYLPRGEYQWNSAGGTNRIEQIDTGSYEVVLPGIGSESNGGTALVTAYGVEANRCKVEQWYPDGIDTRALVRCYNTNGNRVNSLFTFSFMSDLVVGELGDYGAFLWANDRDEASYVPNATYSYANTGFRPEITRQSRGRYIVRLPALQPDDSTTAIATAYGSQQQYCTIEGWSSNGADGTEVRVTCFDRNGDPFDSMFTLLYLTDDPF